MLTSDERRAQHCWKEAVDALDLAEVSQDDPITYGRHWAAVIGASTRSSG